jgi:hypothetical protein
MMGAEKITENKLFPTRSRSRFRNRKSAIYLGFGMGWCQQMLQKPQSLQPRKEPGIQSWSWPLKIEKENVQGHE